MQDKNSSVSDKPGNWDVLIEFLADRYSREILSISTDTEFSAVQLINELGIPRATVYRKLKLLEEAGLIKHFKTVINLAGNEEKYYRCLLHRANVNLNNGKLSVDLDVEKGDNGAKIITIWQRLVHTAAEAAVL